jgi:hypothetical protein
MYLKQMVITQNPIIIVKVSNIVISLNNMSRLKYQFLPHRKHKDQIVKILFKEMTAVCSENKTVPIRENVGKM